LKDTYIFDACALIAVLTNENGSEVVKDLLQKAVDDKIGIIMHRINFLEVYYDTYKKYGEKEALKLIENMKISPIKFNNDMTDEFLIKAGRLKGSYKISIADSIGLAETITANGCFVTADHHELEIVQQKEHINIIWIREKLIKKSNL
jgi:predicted nucleic acid-binding protein